MNEADSPVGPPVHSDSRTTEQSSDSISESHTLEDTTRESAHDTESEGHSVDEEDRHFVAEQEYSLQEKHRSGENPSVDIKPQEAVDTQDSVEYASDNVKESEYASDDVSYTSDDDELASDNVESAPDNVEHVSDDVERVTGNVEHVSDVHMRTESEQGEPQEAVNTPDLHEDTSLEPDISEIVGDQHTESRTEREENVEAREQYRKELLEQRELLLLQKQAEYHYEQQRQQRDPSVLKQNTRSEELLEQRERLLKEQQQQEQQVDYQPQQHSDVTEREQRRKELLKQREHLLLQQRTQAMHRPHHHQQQQQHDPVNIKEQETSSEEMLEQREHPTEEQQQTEHHRQDVQPQLQDADDVERDTTENEDVDDGQKLNGGVESNGEKEVERNLRRSPAKDEELETSERVVTEEERVGGVEDGTCDGEPQKEIKDGMYMYNTAMCASSFFLTGTYCTVLCDFYRCVSERDGAGGESRSTDQSRVSRRPYYSHDILYQYI